MKKTNVFFNNFLLFVRNLIMWVGGLFVWFWYTYLTIDRSEAAYQANDNYGPMVSGYSLFLLAVLLAFLLSKHFFSKKKNVKSILVKLLVIFIAVIGLFSQLAYDADLSKLRSYWNLRNSSFTGEDLFVAVNKHRQSVGVPEISIEETFCGNLVERWLAIKNPNNGHQGLEDWWAEKQLENDPYGQINELYASATSADRVIEMWRSSPGHKIPLENPSYNVGCTYAADGLGVLIIGEKK